MLSLSQCQSQSDILKPKVTLQIINEQKGTFDCPCASCLYDHHPNPRHSDLANLRATQPE